VVSLFQNPGVVDPSTNPRPRIALVHSSRMEECTHGGRTFPELPAPRCFIPPSGFRFHPHLSPLRFASLPVPLTGV
jgi:hypothetical protein